MTSNRGGFALVFVILLLVGLLATIGGMFVNMMRHEREIQRISHENQAHWLTEAVIDRTFKLFSDYIKTTDRFPETQSDGNGNKIVTGADADAVTNGKTFERYLIDDWYEGQTNGLRARFPDPLSRIQISSVTIKELNDLGNARRYEVTVAAKHLTTQVETQATQQALIKKGNLFDFSVFYDEDLEIIPGPNMTLQGPVFSNKNIYLMDDVGRTLTLIRADDYEVSNNPQNYVLQSAKNIYFYFKRLMGKNYMLQNDAYQQALATGGIPSIYATDNSSIYPPADGAELYPSTYDPNATDGRESPMLPLFYYAGNGAKLANASGTAVAGGNNSIFAENESGSLVGLTPSHAILQQLCANLSSVNGSWLIICRSYTPTYSTQPSGSKMNTSSAFAPGSLPRLVAEWTLADPASSDPTRNSNWWGDDEDASPLGRNVLDLQPQQIVSTGDPTKDDHLIIEPLTSIFPAGSFGTRATEPDTPEMIDSKFQSQANLNLYCTGSCTNANYSSDLAALVNAGVVTISGGFRDDRIGTGGRKVLTVDLEKLFMTMNGDSEMVYIHLYPLTAAANYPTIARLVNGKKLPQDGFTVATNGRLWIQGDYDTYDYSKGRNCTESEWDAKNCGVPPAAIFSDSIGVFSNEWQDSAAYDRKVQSNVIVNVAIATGTLPSLLKERFSSCKTDPSGCEQPQITGTVGSFSCSGGLKSDGTPNNPAACEYYRGSGVQCQYDPVTCPYPGKTGIYYLNKLSDFYRTITTYCTFEGQTNCITPKCLPGQTPENDHCGAGVDPRLLNWNEIPIVADASRTGRFLSAFTSGQPEVQYARGQLYGQRGTMFLDVPSTESEPPPGIRKFPGLHYGVLYKAALYMTIGTKSSGTCLGTPTQCGPSLVCPVGQACDGVDQEDDTYECLSWECPTCPANYTSADYPCWAVTVTTQGTIKQSQILYWPAPYPTIPLYEAKYSGGLENLINLQESWSHAGGSMTLRFSGVLSALWKSWELYDNGTGEPAYYGSDPGYYTAPERKFDYNESLRTNPPPATPGVFSIKREKWSRG